MRDSFVPILFHTQNSYLFFTWSEKNIRIRPTVFRNTEKTVNNTKTIHLIFLLGDATKSHYNFVVAQPHNQNRNLRSLQIDQMNIFSFETFYGQREAIHKIWWIMGTPWAL